MIIQNFLKLAKTRKQKTALQILEAGLVAALPEKPLKKIVKHNQITIGKKNINLSKYENIYLIAIGKAADSMAKTINSLTNIKSGFIVIPKGSKPIIKDKKFKIFCSSHPTPNKTSVSAAKTILNFLQKRNKHEFVIFLISGGASALFALPEGITLEQKIQVTNLLLRSGASISELNCIRKHLSKVKGGKLVQNMQCDGISFVMSDVIENDLSSIASGITYYDKTTYGDALKIIKKYNLTNKMPKKVLDRLKDGASGKIPETPKKSKLNHHIILTNSKCIEAMVKKAKKLGITTKTNTMSGNVKAAAAKLALLYPKKRSSCLVFGGETTVCVSGGGSGGRNQELVLRILKKLQTKQCAIIASLGTDGIDGNTKYAGAITKNIVVKSNEIISYLKNSDSSSFFQKHGGLIKTGHTHTNLMDVGIILN